MEQGSETTKPTAGETDGWEWCLVEIFGHRSHAGRVREEERFGAKMMRVDVPLNGLASSGWLTHWYSGASIFSIRLSDEETVMNANRPYESPYRLTARSEAIVDADAGPHAADSDGGMPF